MSKKVSYAKSSMAVLSELRQPRTLGEITTSLGEQFGHHTVTVKDVIKKMLADDLIDMRVIGRMCIYWRKV